MRGRYDCPVCAATASFAATSCPRCGAVLGWLPADRRLVALAVDGATVTVLPAADTTEPADTRRWWRCLNLARGCNWLLPAGAEHGFCESCALTGARPGADSIDGMRNWSIAEAAKRRAVDQLRALGLPLYPRSRDHGGVVFDFLDRCGPGCTGYHDGTIGIDLRESDDVYREARRVEFAEPLRTVLGHLRHEIGHHLFEPLVVRAGQQDACRALFGDERAPYAEAIAAHHGGPAPWPPGFLTAYAAAHPSEDWAECVAHYLHVRDALDHLTDDAASAPAVPFAALVDRWRSAVAVADAVAAGLGLPSPYPIRLDDTIVAKLAFVHERFGAYAG